MLASKALGVSSLSQAAPSIAYLITVASTIHLAGRLLPPVAQRLGSSCNALFVSPLFGSRLRKRLFWRGQRRKRLRVNHLFVGDCPPIVLAEATDVDSRIVNNGLLLITR